MVVGSIRQLGGAPVVSGKPQDFYRPTIEKPRAFGQRAPLEAHRFIHRLLSRAERKPTYDPELAYSLAVIAGWSYSDGQTLSNKLQYFGLPFNTVHGMRVVNEPMFIVASAYFVRSECGRVGVLSFRGTEPTSANNWLTDADVSLRPISGGRVHSGFYTNLQAIWDDVVVRVTRAIENQDGADLDVGGSDGRKKREPLRALYITGHSLGGAMATLAAAKIHEDAEIPPSLVKGVYTFGQPAVGDPSFGRQCERRFGDVYHRHVYREDVVPHLPPISTGDYAHFGLERHSSSPHEPYAESLEETRLARFAVPPVAITAVSFVSRRQRALARIPLPYSIDDHLPSRYIDASRAALSD